METKKIKLSKIVIHLDHFVKINKTSFYDFLIENKIRFILT